MFLSGTPTREHVVSYTMDGQTASHAGLLIASPRAPVQFPPQDRYGFLRNGSRRISETQKQHDFCKTGVFVEVDGDVRHIEQSRPGVFAKVADEGLAALDHAYASIRKLNLTFEVGSHELVEDGVCVVSGAHDFCELERAGLEVFRRRPGGTCGIWRRG